MIIMVNRIWAQTAMYFEEKIACMLHYILYIKKLSILSTLFYERIGIVPCEDLTQTVILQVEFFYGSIFWCWGR